MTALSEAPHDGCMLFPSRALAGSFVVALLITTVGCGDSDASDGSGSGASGQGGAAAGGMGQGAAGATGQGGTGTGGAATGGAAPGGMGQGGFGGCSGTCTHDLQAMFDDGSAPLSRAVYGLTSPAQSSSGEWQIHLEVHEGGDPGCPTQASPTPKHTLVVAGLPAALPATPLTEADDLSATLLDFDGALLPMDIATQATAITITPVDSSICTACVGQGPDPSGFVSVDFDATFPEGTIAGHIYATHCESLDLP